MTDDTTQPQTEIAWLTWVKRLRSIAQAGLTYAESPFDRERYEQILALAAEIAAAGTGDDPAKIRGLFAGEQGYETPKVDVRGVVFRDDRILLVRELLDGGRWTLPGGWADVSDRPGEAVEREVWEESGYRVRATKLLAVLDRRFHGHHPPHPYGIYKLFFLCELLGGEAASSIETSGAAFFPEDGIPELSVSRTTEAQIARLFEHHRDPSLSTDFD